MTPFNSQGTGEIKDRVECGSCGENFSASAASAPEIRRPCPNCGSLTRHVYAYVTEGLRLLEKIGIKHKRPGLRKPIYESVQGIDLYNKTRIWNYLQREIDRENDRYFEIIRDGQTGDIIHFCDERLTDHWGHGDAKRKSM